MLTMQETLKVLQSYNINSQKYGPTIYQNKSEYGICLEIKDSNFGFLTRGFLFHEKKDLEDFLKMHFWYKNNSQKYNITLSLDKYNTPTPKINYTYKGNNLTLSDMLNMEDILKLEEKELKDKSEKEVYLKNIENLTNYLMEIRKRKIENKEKKNRLKTEENDLKYELLSNLTTYYGKERTLEKRLVSLERVQEIDNHDLLENLNNMKNESTSEVEKYLSDLLAKVKEEEIEEANLVNIYSNSIYEYNIEILKKQINFVKKKIEAEKNFNLKGSKIHNIDEELKSFLKTNNSPIKIEQFLEENRNRINEKFSKVTDLKNAFNLLNGTNIILPTNEIASKTNINVIKELREAFDKLDEKTKALLTLYNSFYKNICNKIINKNYPSIEEIKNESEIKELYEDLESVVFYEQNSHYLNKYFKYINFTDIDTYISSIIEICKTLENTKLECKDNLTCFYIEDENTYKSLTINPIYRKDKNMYLVTIPKNENVIFIPDKIEIDEDTKEFSILTTKNIYTKESMIEGMDSITLNEYEKIQEKVDNIIITNNLKLKSSTTFMIGEIIHE